MPVKKCEGYKTPEGKKNPNCEKRFYVENNNYKRKVRCESCQRLKNNEYHRNYLKKWRDRKKK